MCEGEEFDFGDVRMGGVPAGGPIDGAERDVLLIAEGVA